MLFSEEWEARAGRKGGRQLLCLGYKMQVKEECVTVMLSFVLKTKIMSGNTNSLSSGNREFGSISNKDTKHF